MTENHCHFIVVVGYLDLVCKRWRNVCTSFEWCPTHFSREKLIYIIRYKRQQNHHATPNNGNPFHHASWRIDANAVTRCDSSSFFGIGIHRIGRITETDTTASRPNVLSVEHINLVERNVCRSNKKWCCIHGWLNTHQVLTKTGCDQAAIRLKTNPYWRYRLHQSETTEAYGLLGVHACERLKQCKFGGKKPVRKDVQYTVTDVTSTWRFVRRFACHNLEWHFAQGNPLDYIWHKFLRFRFKKHPHQ